MVHQQKPQKLAWIDLEMTGLDPLSQRIIEVAIIVTDVAFEELERYEAIIHQPDSVLDAAEEWPKTNMSSLFEEVRGSATNEQQAVVGILELLKRHFGNEQAVLAGNSIHQDRRFIRQWWPEVDAQLHYRMLDVSSFKIVVQGLYGVEFEKSKAHRALGDIQESIAELKWSLSILGKSTN